MWCLRPVVVLAIEVMVAACACDRHEPPHPQQMKGHRTTTVLQQLGRFLQRQHERGYASFWQLTTDTSLDAPASSNR